MESVAGRTTSKTVRDKYFLLWPGEIQYLKKLSQSLPDYPVIVNIGAGKGTSGLAFMESRNDVRLYTVDINQVNKAGDGLAAERKAFLGALFPTGEQFWHQILMPSSQAGFAWGDSWEMPKVDMVFVDADHSYAAVINDINSWLPNIKDGGIIAFHDYRTWEVTQYGPSMYGPTTQEEVTEGVARAVDELVTGKFETIGRRDTIIAFRVRNEQDKEE